MAKMPDSIKVEVTQLRVIYFPIACMTKMDDVVGISVLGFTVYRRTGDKRKFLWWTY